jgi:eukaryotic-like serine/threonine-protein kinase
MNDPSDDPRLAELLDAYLAALQSGGRPDREALLRDHPELGSALRCIDALEDLAPEPGGGAEPAEAAAGQLDADGAGPVAADWPRPFGQYELLREIGRGGMGVVYQARQPALDRLVAVKMVLASQMASAEHVRRFLVEARTAARLQHPGIVPIHDVGQVHGQHYFAMQYIDGQSLADRLTVGPMEPDEAVALLVQVARAVDYLHQANILHRDLKPSNVLIDCDGHPFVADFGLAKFFEPGSQSTASGLIAGTPSYMAPEQAAGRRDEIGPAADVYGLGAILYEMLTGRAPFGGETPVDTIMQVLGRDPTPPRQLNPKVPRGLERICLKCLAKSPGERYAGAAALADDLERLARGEALEARAPTLGDRLWSWARRQPALAIRLGGLGAFYVVEWAHYLAGVVDLRFHLAITGLVFLWAMMSVMFQQIVGRRRWTMPACFLWGSLDSALLLAVLLTADGAASPLVVGYPLLVVGSAFWFRVRYVWFITATSIVSYWVLVWDFHFWREAPPRFDPGFDRHVIFSLALAVLGTMVAYLVHRVRQLSSFYGRPA